MTDNFASPVPMAEIGRVNAKSQHPQPDEPEPNG